MNYTRDFDLSLADGQIKEQQLSAILTDSNIEVKTDYMAQRTGNIAVEFESRGKRHTAKLITTTSCLGLTKPTRKTTTACYCAVCVT